MRDGVGTAFLTGLLLVGCSRPATATSTTPRSGSSFAIGLVLLVLVMANMRKPSIPQGLWA
jgi:hypothetical protein